MKEADKRALIMVSWILETIDISELEGLPADWLEGAIGYVRGLIMLSAPKEKE